MSLPALAVDDVVNVDTIAFDEPVGWVVLVMTGLAVVVGPWVLLLGTRQLRRGYEIRSNEPVGAGEAHLEDGVVEVEGTASTHEGTLTGTYTDEPALACTWRRQRKEERTDDDGTTTTSWRTVSKGSDAVPFRVEDDTGAVVVDPTEASLSIDQSRVRSGGWLKRRNDTYREYEGRIEPGESVHVYGQMRSGSDVPGDEGHYIADGSEVSEFVVSDGSEFRTVLRYAGRGLLLVFAAALWIPITTVAFLFMLEAAFGVPVASWFVEWLG